MIVNKMSLILKCYAFCPIIRHKLLCHTRVLSHMSAWEVTNFCSDIQSSITLNNNCPFPVINSPNDVLIKVNATSVNPIDVRITQGYGHTLLSLMQNVSECGIQKITYDRLPVIPGRDVSGVVIGTGKSVKRYKTGDLVWGSSPPHRQGTHAQYVVTNECNIYRKPKNVSDTAAAALPFVALSAWAAISTFGGLNERNTFGKKVLVLGGSGGAGIFAIQLLKHWGAHVVTSCAGDAIDFVTTNTGADQCIDYNSNELLQHLGTFDYVIDTIGSGTGSGMSKHRDRVTQYAVKYLKKWSNAKLVTLSSPIITNIDNYGLLFGTAFSTIEASKITIDSLRSGVSTRWAYYCSNQCALSTVTRLVEDGAIKPVIERVINFQQIPEAYAKVAAGHARGKTVIDLMVHEQNATKFNEIKTEPKRVK